MKYTQINAALRRLGHHPAATKTLAEHTSTLSVLVPGLEHSTRLLLEEYQVETYSFEIPDIQLAVAAGSKIKSYTYRVYLRRWLSNFISEMYRSKKG